MTKRQALRIAAECIAVQMAPLAKYLNSKPEVSWVGSKPMLKDNLSEGWDKYERYQQLEKAMHVIEDEILGQGELQF